MTLVERFLIQPQPWVHSPSNVCSNGVLIILLASQGAGIISEVIASQPPEAAIKAEARNSMIVTENMFHSKAHGMTSSEDASEENRDHTWDIDLSLYPAPTEEEEKTLKKIAGSIPWVAYCLCFVEFAERASYYGAQTVFANFLTYPLPHGMLNPTHFRSDILMHAQRNMARAVIRALSPGETPSM